MSPLIETLREILPLFVGSGVSIAFVNLVVRQSKPERIPPMARRLNQWGVDIASLTTVAASVTALYYAGFRPTSNVITVSYGLLVAAFLLLIVAFIIPPIFNAIHPLWRKTFYPQFEAAQAKDAKGVKAAARGAEGTEETTSE